MFRPDAASLLEVARDTLLAELLPRLPADSRYAALMIANAMAIATREVRAGPSLTRATDRLRQAAASVDGTRGGDPGTDWSTFEALLARHIRRMSGAVDAGSSLYEALAAVTHFRLAIDNPRALADYVGAADKVMDS